MKQVVEMSLEHFSSSELCPPVPVIVVQRDAWLLGFAVLHQTLFKGIFDNGFSTWFSACCRKIGMRSWCITKHHLKMHPCLFVLRGV